MLKNLPNLSLHMLISVMLIKEKTCKADYMWVKAIPMLVLIPIKISQSKNCILIWNARTFEENLSGKTVEEISVRGINVSTKKWLYLHRPCLFCLCVWPILTTWHKVTIVSQSPSIHLNCKETLLWKHVFKVGWFNVKALEVFNVQ